jgi:glutamine amidotransferase
MTDNEAWSAMPPGTLWWFSDGVPVRTLATIAGPEKQAAAC